ncbi:MAG: MauE/DoxX family redox-associated membrane protein [Thermoanaerobaculia bacterium]
MKAIALLIGRVALGAVFVVAAVPKIADPPSFAHMISNYELLPAPAVNPVALFLPWLEFLTGLALATGVFGRTGAKLAAALLGVFIVAIGINLARGHLVQCGCFDVHAAEKSHAQLAREMYWVLARDLGLLALAAWLSQSHESAKRISRFLRKSQPEEK